MPYPEYWALSWRNPSRNAIDTAIRELRIGPADFASLQGWVEEFLSETSPGQRVTVDSQSGQPASAWSSIRAPNSSSHDRARPMQPIHIGMANAR